MNQVIGGEKPKYSVWISGPNTSFKFLPNNLESYLESLLPKKFNIDDWKGHNWKSLMHDKMKKH